MQNVGPYTVGPTPVGLGVGTENFALGVPYSPPNSGMYGPRYNVRQSMGPRSNGYVNYAQKLMPADLLGNALYFTGSFALMPLSGAGRAGNG